MKTNKKLSDIFLTATHSERSKMLDTMLDAIQIDDELYSYYFRDHPFTKTIWNWAIKSALDRFRLAVAVSEAVALRERFNQLTSEKHGDELHYALENEICCPLIYLLDNTPGCRYESRTLYGLSDSDVKSFARTIHIKTALDALEGMMDE